jgi:hypothetical protein
LTVQLYFPTLSRHSAATLPLWKPLRAVEVLCY